MHVRFHRIVEHVHFASSGGVHGLSCGGDEQVWPHWQLLGQVSIGSHL